MLEVTALRDLAGMPPCMTPKDAPRLVSLDGVIPSLETVGMANDDIDYHFVTTLGGDLNTDTPRTITDAVADEGIPKPR